MRFTLSLLLIVYSSIAWTQNRYPKKFYLITIKDDFQFLDGEKTYLDSILKVYHSVKSDSIKLNYVKHLSEALPSHDLWSKYNSFLEQKTVNSSIGYRQKLYCTVLNNYGYEAQNITNDWKKAEYYYLKLEKYAKKVKDEASLGVAYNNLAFLYQHQGDLIKAIDKYSEAGLLFEKRKEYQGMAAIYLNLGYIYLNNDDLQNAESNFFIALKSARKAKNKEQEANILNSLSTVFLQKKNYKKSLFFLKNSMQINRKIKNYCRLGINYLELSKVQEVTHQYRAAKSSLDKALYYSRKCEDPLVIVNIYDNIATYHVKNKNWSVAKNYIDSTIKLTNTIQVKEIELSSLKNLISYYEYKKDYKNAFLCDQKKEKLEKELKNDDVKKAVFKSQFKFEYDKKTAQQQLLNEKKDLIRKNEKQQQGLIITIICIILFASIFVLFFVYRNFKAKKKSAFELTLKNEEISHQKELIEEKQKEIIDSINYAKRIQTAVLSDKETWKRVSDEHFILFQPKDIVSGDFYWAYNVNDHLSIFALADCTGHGVPGGFMSMLGNSFLNEIVIENKMYDSAIILNKLREKIIFALEQKSNDYQQKDGMDISLCVWDKSKNELSFSGAHNHLWLVRNRELNEFKADKMPIGFFIDNSKSFGKTLIQLEKNDMIYLSTDGYADQFGGEKEKKFKVKNLHNLLVEISQLPLNNQYDRLLQNFIDWKGNYEQVDDVSVIAVKIST